MARRPSHWPAKFSVKAAALGSCSMRSTCSRSMSGWLSLPCSASVSSSSSGIELHRKYDSRLARAKSSSLPGFSRRNRKCGDTSTALRPTRIACSNEAFASSLAFTRARNGLMSSSVTARRKARRVKSRRIRSASASGCFETTSRRLRVLGGRRRRLRQVAEEPAMARRRPGVVQRPFDLHPLDRPGPAPCSSPRPPSRPRAASRPARPRRSESCSCGSRRSTNSITVGLSAGTS